MKTPSLRSFHRSGSRWSRVCLVYGGLFIAGLFSAFAVDPPVAVANVPGTIKGKPFNKVPVTGPGAVGTVAIAGGKGDMTDAKFDPAIIGDEFSDVSKIDGTMETHLANKAAAEDIGKKLLRAYRQAGGGNALNAERALEFNVVESKDKVADAKAAANKTLELKSSSAVDGVLGTKVSADAKQSVTLQGAGAIATATAEATIEVKNKNQGLPPTFAAALVNDPITFAFDFSDPSPTVIELTIDKEFTLQATEPGTFASAIYEVGKGFFPDLVTGITDIALGFSINLSYDTKQGDNLIDIFAFDEAFLGYDEAFFRSRLNAALIFDDITHQITLNHGTNDFSLHSFALDSSTTQPINVRFDFGGIVGSIEPVPEVTTLWSAGVLGSLVLGVAWNRRRAGKGP